ncbi:MAG: lysophospholipid acyltransferase family protein [Oceanipulchritudo sp.]|jgi:lysophospholipid acyltransferase (LPLAT)-like uncharacterized protein
MKRTAAEPHDPWNTRRRVVHELKGWQWLAYYPASWGLRLLFLTWRFRVPPEGRKILRETASPRLIVMWHNRTLVAVEMLLRFFDPPSVACMISPSRMAAWEAAFFRKLGFRVVRGSTTRRSVQAGIELVRALRDGRDAGLTPDGPSGPLYSFQEGALAIARKAGVPILLIVPNSRAAWRPRTWDRHLVPLPFARIELRMRVIHPGDPVWGRKNPEAASELRRVCLEMTEDPFTVEE